MNNASVTSDHSGASPEQLSVTRNWIIYNKSTAFASGKEVAHAGILLGLGLQGHLSVLSAPDISNYLTQVTAMTAR
jgi:hypothetical protein